MFGDKLRYLRKRNGYSMDKLAELYNEKYDGKLNKSTISRYENGLQEPLYTTARNFAELFNVTVEYLSDEQSQTEVPNLIPIDPNARFVKIPVIGRVAAGEGCFVDEDILDYEITEEKDIEKGEVYRYLKVSGDSMEPKIEDGDLLLVRQQTSVDSGSVAVVSIDDTDGVVKRVNYGPDWIELKSLNPKYPPRVFEGADVLRIRVLGLVKQIRRKL